MPAYTKYHRRDRHRTNNDDTQNPSVPVVLLMSEFAQRPNDRTNAHDYPNTYYVGYVGYVCMYRAERRPERTGASNIADAKARSRRRLQRPVCPLGLLVRADSALNRSGRSCQSAPTGS